MGIAEKRLRKERLMGLLTDGTRPVSVRNLFYQMVGQGWIEKTDGGYQKVAKCLIEMRRAKEVPYDWISDGTRNPIGATSQYERGVETTIAELLDSCSPDTSLWAYAARQPGGRLKHPQVWIESRSAAGMIEDITRRYEVSLWPTAGHSSLTLLYRGGGRRPTNVAVLTDWDKAGLTIRKNTRKDLRWFGAGAAHFGERAWLSVYPRNKPKNITCLRKSADIAVAYLKRCPPKRCGKSFGENCVFPLVSVVAV